jgi:hypothetical protein
MTTSEPPELPEPEVQYRRPTWGFKSPPTPLLTSQLMLRTPDGLRFQLVKGTPEG